MGVDWSALARLPTLDPPRCLKGVVGLLKIKASIPPLRGGCVHVSLVCSWVGAAIWEQGGRMGAIHLSRPLSGTRSTRLSR